MVVYIGNINNYKKALNRLMSEKSFVIYYEGVIIAAWRTGPLYLLYSIEPAEGDYIEIEEVIIDLRRGNIISVWQ